MSGEDDLKVEQLGATLVLTMNRPEAMNAIDPSMAAALRSAWQQAAGDDAIRVVVLTGAGERAFCAGADLKRTPPPPRSFAQTHLNREVTVTAVTPPADFVKPVIAAVNGIAVGGGFELALATDIQIAATSARFGLTEARIGSLPGAGGTQRLARRVPIGIAQRWLLTGEIFDADTALRFGLVSELVDSKELVVRALEIAGLIAANAPLAVRAGKRALYAAQDQTLAQGLEYEQLLWGALRDTHDRLEGRAAFAEKRPPQYRGR
ncbi:enoyl-CoA hydratase/isomerase family protein [Nocardia aurea]|uniref:enoyl-CoA hydratase/isomerase family protein n=1 Tax=Nocardia aurea TaxID=2144174 RepID=UPI001E5FFDDE|nr:enoyl-CoA hydratase/isomerase family protein [Nocardia aurea]